jgi:chromosome segregation ATPase
MTTLAEINKLLGDEIAGDLRGHIAIVKAAVTSSYEGILADKDAEVTAARDAMQKQLDDTLAANAQQLADCQAKIAALEKTLADPTATIDDIKAEKDKSDKQRKREELQKQKDQAVVDAAAKASEIDAQIAELEAAPAPAE